jgi:protein SCO1/2
MASCGGDGDRELVGYTLEPAPQVDEVALPDVSRDGEPFELRAQPGGLLIVYFGYTNCPDICPTTMSDVRTALRQLGDDADKVGVAMVTIDPDRDTPVLADYVNSFVEGGPCARHRRRGPNCAPSPIRSASAISSSRTLPARSKSPTPRSCTSSTTPVRLALTWQFGVTADDLAGDLEQLLETA